MLDLGSKRIELSSWVGHDEDMIAWPEVLDELVWPALRAWGFILDQEFTDSIAEYHRDWLAEKMTYKPEVKTE